MGRALGLIQSKQKWERSTAPISEIFDPKAAAKQRARESILDFSCYTFSKYQVNWHHQLIGSIVDDLLRGKCPRLILSMPPRYGKCLAQGTEVLLADGRITPIENVRPSDMVTSVDSCYNSCISSVSEIADNGIKPVLKITLQSGRSLICTENHPLLTVLGWQAAGSLKVGDGIAALRKTPIPEGESLPIGFASLMGYITGDGSFGAGQPIITTADPEVVAHLKEIADAHGWVLYRDGKYSYHIRRTTRKGARGTSAVERLRVYMKPAKSINKRVPECIFQANHQDLCAFLAAYFNSDGHANTIINVAEFYSTSEGLLKDVQTLLTRLGIYSALRLKKGRYKGKVHLSYRLILSGEDAIRFSESLPIIGDRGRHLKVVAKAISQRARHFPEHEAIPPDWKTLMKRSTSWHRENSGIRVDKIYKNGTARQVVEAIAKAEKNLEILKLCNPDITWEPIVKIEPLGDQPTYDLEIADTHNFIANGVVAHNSELLSRRLPAYLLGLNPNAQIISTSYASDLASRINRDVQRIIDNDRYRELFPQSSLNTRNVSSDAKGSYLRNSEIFEIVRHTGSYRSAGVGGGINGMGFGALTKEVGMGFISGLGVVDDPFKNRKEAESLTVRDSVWEWYTSTFRSRAEGDAAILIVATRWNADDLIGRLLKQSRENPKADQWKVVNFAAIRGADEQPDDPRKEGEPLWYFKHSLDELITLRASVGEYDWASLYQQSPSIEGGNLFNVDWWTYWYAMPKFDRVLISLNAKFKEVSSASFVTLQAWGKAGSNYYLIDQLRDRLSYLDAKDAISGMVDRLNAQGIVANELLIEDKKNGKAIIESLAADCPVTVTATNFNGDTEAGRAQAVTSFFKTRSVFLPTSSNALWVDGLLSELTDFPNGESDDQTGALTQALIYMALRDTSGKVYKYFSRSTNGLRGQDAIDFAYDSAQDLHISFDWNRSPACAIVAQVRDSEVFILREWYLQDSDTFQLSETVGQWILDQGHRQQINIYGDASGNQRTANSKESNWQIFWSTFKRLGLKPHCRKRYRDANPPVNDRVLSVNHLFMSERAYILLEHCPELVKDFELIGWKNDGIDKSDLARSHLSDAAGYLFHTLFPYRTQGHSKRSSQKPLSGIAG